MLVPWLPTSASEEMDRIEFTFWFTTVICIGVFAVVAAAIVYSVLNFRVQPEDESDGPPIHGHTGLEIVWTAIPAVLVTAISIVSAIVLAQNDDAGPNPLRISVTAQQFAWKFEYPGDDKVVSGELVLPVDRPVKLTLHSLDVIHSFWVPEFGQKSDAVPGIETTLVITPTRIGEYRGHLHGALRARALDHARARSRRRAGGVREVPGRRGRGRRRPTRPRARRSSRPPAAAAVTPSRPRAPTRRSGRAWTRSIRGGRPLDEFLRESIEDPNAVLAPGYQGDVMPNTYGKSLSEEQLDALVQYLVDGQKGSE